MVLKIISNTFCKKLHLCRVDLDGYFDFDLLDGIAVNHLCTLYSNVSLYRFVLEPENREWRESNLHS